MTNNLSEKNLLPLAEQAPLPRAESTAREQEKTAVEKLSSEEGKAGSLETIGKVKELLSLKRRPKIVLPIVRDEVTLKVEKILEDGLGDSFSRLSPIAQQEFKLRGEETARSIRELLQTTHVKVKKIFQLIFLWLKMLPGINHFFLEQEAKIKADRIIALHKKK